MTRDKKYLLGSLQRNLWVILLILVTPACAASVDSVLFTSESFPPKSSAADIKLLGEEPSTPHIKLAQLSVAESKQKLYKMQLKIREKAAALGADAVVFTDPEVSYESNVSYAPVYRPWGYWSPNYGWYGGGYASAMPVTNKVRRNTLIGIAIKYINDTGN